MRREFKFKALDIAKNEMLDVESISDIYVTVSPRHNDDEGNYSYELQHKLFDDDSGKIEAIVVEYTGYRDVNDDEIWEGDILKVCNGSINGRLWMDKDYTAVKKKYDGSFTIHSFMWDEDGNNCMDSTHWCEVIGNIYENKELLK